MDSSPLKAEHIHVLSPRARFRENDGRVARAQIPREVALTPALSRANRACRKL